ncbi:MAG: extracellular solute-binding protein [Pseudomonadota bacterium]
MRTKRIAQHASRKTAAHPRMPRRRWPIWIVATGAWFFGAFWVGADDHVADSMIKSHGISTFGALKYPADFSHLDYVNPEAPKGGEISVWSFGSFDSMHPYSVEGRAGGLSSIFFESMLAGTADEIGSAYGLLAESLEYPEDRSEAIFNLRPEARFSDGSPLTADDVLFSYEVLRDKGLSSYRAQLGKQVKDVEILSPHRIRFVFDENIPTRDLPASIGAIPIFSKAHYEANGRDFDKASLEPLLGSGPYILADMDVGKTIVYRRDPTYWGSHLPLNVGRNNFDTIRLEYFADYDTAFVGFKAGAYTFRNEASSKIWATGYDFPAVRKGWVRKVEIPHGRKVPNQVFVFNLRREKFQDPRVREALGLMFNFDWSNGSLFYGIYDRTSSFWANSDLQALGAPSAAERAILEPLIDILPEGTLNDTPFSWPNGGQRQAERGMLRRAGRLLDAAGWTVGDDGMRRNIDGELLSVEILDDSQTRDRVLLPYVENLRRLGVDAFHNRIDNAQMIRRGRPPEYDFDIITARLPTAYVPWTELRQYFGSETADSSTFNKMGLRSAAVDRVIDEVVAARTQDELKTAVSALDRVLRAERFSVPQWFKAVDTIAYYDMYRHPENLPPYALGELSFWWYDAERAAELKAAGAF